MLQSFMMMYLKLVMSSIQRDIFQEKKSYAGWNTSNMRMCCCKSEHFVESIGAVGLYISMIDGGGVDAEEKFGVRVDVES